MKTTLKTGVLGAAVCCVAALWGETLMWTGAAGDNAWTTPANWSSSALPASDAMVVFTNTVTVTPPADFAGVLYATNATVTLVVDDDAAAARAFSTALDIGAKLVKAGAGALTLRAAPGYYPGGIQVNAGSVTFAGNGAFAAPGMFGPLSVASGAAVTVADSPAADRHGVVVRAEKWEKSFADAWQDFTNCVVTVTAFADTWDALGASGTERDRWIHRPDGVSTFHLKGNQTVAEPFYATNTCYVTLSRALIAIPASARVAPRISVDDYGLLICDGVNWSAIYNNGSVWLGTRRLAAGWHALDTAYYEHAGDHRLDVRLTSPFLPKHTYLGPNLLWKGVCFTDLKLDADATLTVADGQAVAFVCGNDTSVAGKVVGGADAVFAVMGGKLAADAAAFASFSGNVEVAAYGALVLANVPADPSFTCTGAGTFAAANELSFDSAFTGTVDVPAGTVYTNELGDAVSFTGAGTLVTDTLVGTADFDGTVVLRERAAGDMTDVAGFAPQTLRLANGASVSIAGGAAWNSFEKSLPDWNADRDAWNLITYQGVKRDYLNEVGMYVTNNGVLVVTDDTGSQRNTAVYTNRAFAAEDIWRIRFTFSSTLLNRWPHEVRAEAFSFFLAKSPAAHNHNNQGAYPGDAYGFNIYQYRAGAQGLTWILNGSTDGNPDYTEKAMGISLLKPIDMDVSYRDGMLTVVMTQGAATFSSRCDISEAFMDGTCRYFGFGGGTGWWANAGDIEGAGGASAAVYCYQTISNFMGSVVDVSAEAGPDVSFTTGDWMLVNDMTLLPGGTNGVETTSWSSGSAGTNGIAICQTAFSPHQAFWLDLDERLVSTAPENTAWAEGLSIFFRPSPLRDESSTAYWATGNPSIALKHYFYINNFGLEEEDWRADDKSGYPADNATSKSLGTNHIRIFYDGAGRFTATVSRGTTAKTFKKDYAKILTWDKFYMGLKSATSSWGAYLKTHVLDPVVTQPVPGTAVVDTALEVAADAAATVAVGGWTTNDVASVGFATTTLQDGGVLNVVSAVSGRPAVVAFRDLAVNGATKVVAADGNAVELANVVVPSASDVLTVEGNWTAVDGRVTFRVDAAALPTGGRVLADFSRASYVGAGEPEFVCTGLNGEDLSARWRVSVANGVVRLTSRGFLLIFR